nr:MAG TPA: Protein of unknown function (DUF2570) [Caudoviricetes sp.]
MMDLDCLTLAFRCQFRAYSDEDQQITIVAILLVVVVTIIAVLSVLLVRSNAVLATSESDNRVLRSDNALQATVITTQALSFNRFNQIADNANRLNLLIDAGTEKTVIEYREILRREKPVICLFLLMSLVGCSTTRTVYVPAQCTPIPGTLTQPLIVPLPPAQ